MSWGSGSGGGCRVVAGTDQGLFLVHATTDEVGRAGDSLLGEITRLGHAESFAVDMPTECSERSRIEDLVLRHDLGNLGVLWAAVFPMTILSSKDGKRRLTVKRELVDTVAKLTR